MKCCSNSVFYDLQDILFFKTQIEHIRAQRSTFRVKLMYITVLINFELFYITFFIFETFLYTRREF